MPRHSAYSTPRGTARAAFLASALAALLGGTQVNAQSAVEENKIVAGEWTFDARVAGPPDGPLVLMLHGFPQSSFEWRHQMPVLAGLGFRVVAPDQRGYSPGC